MQFCSRCLFWMFVCFVVAGVNADAASIALAWDPPVDGETTGYIVRYGTTSGQYSQFVDVGKVTTYRVEGLADATMYFFTVQAYDGAGKMSDLATEVGGMTAGSSVASRPPRQKLIVSAAASGGVIDIAWSPSSGVPIGYRVEVGAASGETAYSAVSSAPRIAFDMRGLPATAYYIRVRSLTNGTSDDVSDEVRIERPGELPAVGPPSADTRGSCASGPAAPRQFAAMAEGSTAHLTWQPGAGQPPTGYLLEVGSAPGMWNLLTLPLGAVLEMQATAAAGAYALRLTAINDCGSSLWGPETILHVGSAPQPLPEAPTLLAPELSGNLLNLFWEAPTGGGPVSRYLIEATTPFGPFAFDTASPLTAFTNLNTPPGDYVVTVRAGNANGFGPASAPVRLTVP